jgi:phage host-nuclease inhibitor protein Gam
MKQFWISFIAMTLLSSSVWADERLSMGEEAIDHEFWISVKDSADPRELEEYLKVFPRGLFSGLAIIKIEQLKSFPSNKSAEDALNLQKIRELEAEVEELKRAVRASVPSDRDSELENSRLKIELETLRRELAAVSLEYRLTKEEVAYLQTELADQVASVKKERDPLIAAQAEEIDSLRNQLSDLESQHNRLVRPARSSVGRFVVEVRFWKNGYARQYSLRESGGLEEIISESDLYQKLSVLKVKHADKLYTKVIPDNNSLTHGEAWGFTNKILNRFDYYYQN